VNDRKERFFSSSASLADCAEGVERIAIALSSGRRMNTPVEIARGHGAIVRRGLSKGRVISGPANSDLASVEPH
jgi:hypothetical protein